MTAPAAIHTLVYIKHTQIILDDKDTDDDIIT